ncbi:MAG: glycosyltransferase, partial [Gammaproteobacteria bacterium]|nr:glycosyltransferase [Gammaproteobacteria bacterium]
MSDRLVGSQDKVLESEGQDIVDYNETSDNEDSKEEAFGPKKVDPKVVIRPKFKIEFNQVYKFILYCGMLFILVWNLPNAIWNPDYKMWLILFGALGIWRYLWWLLHFVRSIYYNQIKFAIIRYQAGELLEQGWRPKKVVFMVTAYNESSYVLEQMMSSINREADLLQVPTELYMATADFEIEEKIRKIWSWIRHSDYLNLIMVRQIEPGKRAAMGSALRCISRKGLGDNDPIIFMDGDTVLTPGTVLKSIPIFKVKPKVHALTTNERPLMNVPMWLQNWFNLRFTQRHMIMQSHAVSNKVITLTGRMSIFRAGLVLNDIFIDLIEKDSLDHWLWGRFRFLSGDDKSSWFALLKQGADMLYVPDATVYTIEEIDEDVSPLHRLKENMLRWSGNILRNGWRGIMLGPRKVGLFAWWCLVDQRIVIFSMMCAPFLMVSGTVIVSSAFIVVYLVWILFSRLCLAFCLFYHNRRMNMAFPFLLYANQLATSVFKIYLLFRLPFQKWANRGDQALPLQGSRP